MPAKVKPPAKTAPAVSPHTVLLAVTGMAPAVLMETVWHLAMKEQPPCIPDVVKVLTTIQGREAIETQLFDTGHWQAMRAQIVAKHPWAKDKLKFGCHAEHVRVFVKHIDGRPSEMGEVIHLDDTEAVGDVILDELWTHVEKPRTHIVASISGGFKTMGALLFSCMTLLAQKTHRIVHVRVNEPYDGSTKPLFYWPDQPEQKLTGTRDGKTYQASKAKITFGDMAFVPLRDVFTHLGKDRPESYRALIEDARMDAVKRSEKDKPHVTLSHSRSEIVINGTTLDFSVKAARQYFLLYFLAKRAIEGKAAIDNYRDAMSKMDEMAKALISHASSPWQSAAAPPNAWVAAVKNHDATPLRKLLDEVKRKLKAKGKDGVALTTCMPEAQHFALSLPPDHITFVD